MLSSVLSSANKVPHRCISSCWNEKEDGKWRTPCKLFPLTRTPTTLFFFYAKNINNSISSANRIKSSKAIYSKHVTEQTASMLLIIQLHFSDCFEPAACESLVFWGKVKFWNPDYSKMSHTFSIFLRLQHFIISLRRQSRIDINQWVMGGNVSF